MIRFLAVSPPSQSQWGGIAGMLLVAFFIIVVVSAFKDRLWNLGIWLSLWLVCW